MNKILLFLASALICHGQVGCSSLSPQSANHHSSVDTTTNDSPELIAYRLMVNQRIQSHWEWNREVSGQRVKLILSIAADGKVSNVRILKSSGEEVFDESVLAAIEHSSPVPPPPQAILDQVKDLQLSIIAKPPE